MEKCYEIVFSYGTVDVFEDRVVIHRKSTFMLAGRTGDKTIYFDNLIGIEKRPAKPLVDFAFIEFETAQHGGQSGSLAENALAFKGSMQYQIDAAYDKLIVTYGDFKKQKNAPQVVQQEESALDKLKKLKELLDIGVISTEEYNAKRQEFLSQI